MIKPMSRIADAFWRAAAYCLHPRVIGLSLLPLIVSAALAFGLGYFFWEAAVAGVRATLESWSLIDGLLNNQIIGMAVVSLLVVKALVWSISLGSGTSGGVLAPLLIIGGSLGAFIGQWLPAGDSGLWAMVAMAGMMGGTMRSPLTGMFFMLELTGDLNALPALLCGSVAALASNRRTAVSTSVRRTTRRTGCSTSRNGSIPPALSFRSIDSIPFVSRTARANSASTLFGKVLTTNACSGIATSCSGW